MSWRLGCTGSHRKGILHRYDLLSEVTWNAQWSIMAGDNSGEHDFACEVLDYGVLSFDRSQCIEFLTRPAVAEGRHLKLRDHHHDTGGKERYISPTLSNAALINVSIPIVHTATRSQVIEHQRKYLLPFPSTLCPTRPGVCKLHDSAVGIYYERAATDCCHWQCVHPRPLASHSINIPTPGHVSYLQC